MFELLTVFVSSLINIWAKALQQRNNVFDNWLSIIPVSYCMSAAQIFSLGIGVNFYIESDWVMLTGAVLSCGTGGWMGCWAGMWTHKKIHSPTV